MKKGLGRRTFLYSVVALVVMYNLIPTFFPNFVPTPEELAQKNLPWYKTILPTNRINLGLDLQGGLHLVLGLDMNQVLDDSTETLERNLTQDLQKRENVTAATHVLVAGKDLPNHKQEIEYSFHSTEDRDKAEKFVGRQYGNDVEFSGRTDLGFRVRYREKTRDFMVKRAVSQSIETIRNRVDEFGVREPSISQQGDDRIVVQFPGINDPERLKRLIGQTAKLEFKLVDNKVGGDTVTKWMDEVKAAGIVYVEGGKEPFSAYMKKVNEFLKTKIPPQREIAFEKRLNRNTQEFDRVPLLLESVPILTGEHLADAYVSYNSDQFGNPEVNMTMTPMGATELAKVSGENIGRAMAIVLDGNVHSAPVIQSKIPNGQARITMGNGASRQEVEQNAHDTALVLRAGSLPATLEFLEERTVGPSLGQDSIKNGILAMELGVGAVFIFMIIYYGISGLIADFALLANVLILLGLLSIFEATLTLPGLAGLALTVGMAVDGNIIIYERIREELGMGRSIHTAVEAGYKVAQSTILDANISTLIAGLFLYQFGTGPIKGFAVSLSLGILTTLMTVLYVSKYLTDIYLKITDEKSFSIGGHPNSDAQVATKGVPS